MDSRFARNLIAVLIVVVVLALLLTFGGCATTQAEYSMPDGTSVKWKSWTLAKDVEEFQAEWGTFSASLGSSRGNFTPEQIACIIAPTKC